MPFSDLQIFALVVVVGVAMQWLGRRLRLPAILLLLLAGLLLGPATSTLDPHHLLGDLLEPIIQLAVAIVLFEGALSLNLREARRVGPVLWRLILSGLVLGFAGISLVAIGIGGLSWPTATTLGAILVVTGPTVILPMLRGARIAWRPATLLKWEGIVNDPFGALLAFAVLQVAVLDGQEIGSGSTLVLLLGSAMRSVLATLLGIAAGWFLGKRLDAGTCPEDLKSPVILAAVFAVFVGGELLQKENGLLAVTAMGLVMANVENASLHGIRHFKEQITTLLVAVLFVLLAANLELEALRALWGAPLWVVLAILFVVRPLTAWVATIRSGLPWQERVLLGWIAPRGVVAAAVAGAFQPRLLETGHQDANLLVPIVFGVIALSVVLHGLSLRPLARWLGLAARSSNGVLLVGASRWASDLARALVRAGAFVVLADSRYALVAQARIEGLEVHFGDVLSEETELELPMERISRVLAGTDDDAYNSLVCMHFATDLGRQATLQLVPADERKESRPHMLGRQPWPDATYPEITRRYWQDQRFKITALTETFGWQQLQEQNQQGLFLFYMVEKDLRVLEADSKPPAGAKVIYMA